MSQPRTYPHGVPSWIDTEQPDPEAAQDFYRELLGWTFTHVSPPGAPYYSIASLDGHDVAGLGAAPAGSAVWNTYIAADDTAATAAKVLSAGGEVVMGPITPGPAGTLAVCRDPAGAEFRLWQAGARLGAQAVNVPGSWNFSDLHTDQPGTTAFYRELFGWEIAELGFATLLRAPGYGDHLEATVDPEIRKRQAGGTAPSGFEDAIAWVADLEPGTTPHWHVSVAVADRDASAAAAQRLGAEVTAMQETRWTRTVLVRDPQGAMFTASQFTPHG